MKAAVAYDNGNIALDFSKARAFKIYDFENGAVTGSYMVEYKGFGHGSVLDLLVKNEVHALICDEISGCFKLPLAAANIHLFAGASGNADDAAHSCAARKLRHDPQAIKADSENCASCSGCC